jgi:hypothetical protein
VSPRSCCEAAPRPASRARRGLAAAGSVAPAAILMLLPKCPACVAAYLAVATGIGVSVTTAAYLRTSLLVLCVTSLGYLAARQVLRWKAARPR